VSINTNLNLTDTICAVSTPYGRGGISVVRVSGSEALSISNKVLKSAINKSESHQALLRRFYDSKGVSFDEGIVIFYRQGSSFTGEDTIEFNCHGNPVICEMLVNLLTTYGCRLAEPGEFTFRALMNNRIDLVQAEAIDSLIHAKSKQSVLLSQSHLQGKLSESFQKIDDQLTYVLAHLEANIDFIEDGLGDLNYENMGNIVRKIIDEIEELLKSSQFGQIVDRGLKVALVGKPNVGKSTLLNSLVESNRSIVTEIPGTTRDYIDVAVEWSGFLINLIDTAGLRDSDDIVESEGIHRGLEQVKESDLVIVLTDEDIFDPKDLFGEGFSKLKGKEMWLARTQVDRKPCDIKYLKESAGKAVGKVFELSAVESIGVDSLKYEIINYIKGLSGSSERVLTKSRQISLLQSTVTPLINCLSLIKAQESPEFISTDLHQVLLRIKDLRGLRFEDDVMDKVFSEFCIGK
jgi:tRNA modification GTPase